MKILLAVDGSPCSEMAVNEVARRPWPTGSEVKVISTYEPFAAAVPETWMLSTNQLEGAAKNLREQARLMVEAAAMKIRAGEDKMLRVTTEVIEGSPRRIIVEEAEKWGADLIVVGSHGYRSWERMLLGSVSQAVATHAECSVEIVRGRKC